MSIVNKFKKKKTIPVNVLGIYLKSIVKKSGCTTRTRIIIGKKKIAINPVCPANRFEFRIDRLALSETRNFDQFSNNYAMRVCVFPPEKRLAPANHKRSGE